MKSLPAMLCAAALFVSPSIRAATITVSTLNDTGTGSLRAAVEQANALAGADTIQFQSNLNGTLTLGSGELAIGDSTTIVGPGPYKLAIDANGASRAFRLVNANAGDKVFAISGLKIIHGNAGAASNDSGGGLFYEAGSIHADIRLTDMVFEGNSAGRKGGAISVTGANLTLDNVVVRGNRVNGSFQRDGGGVYFSRGLLNVAGSILVDNRADYGGGLSIASPAAKAVITDTVFQENTANTGGGIHMITVDSFTLSRSALVENVALSSFGGGIYFSGSTSASAAESVIENSTFSRNESQHQLGSGSALAMWDGNLVVRNATFADNKTAPDTTPGANAGGAMWVNNGGSTRAVVHSSLFNRNTHGNANQPLDLMRKTGTPESRLDVDHSLFQVMPAIGVVSAGSDNIEADAQLMALTTASGGRTPVHPIPYDSPAVDKGSNPAGLATDQRGRGFLRTIDFNPCRRPNLHLTDIGAYEYRGDTIFCHGFEG